MLPTSPFWGGSKGSVIQQSLRLEKNRKRTESEKRKMLPQIFALFIESR